VDRKGRKVFSELLLNEIQTGLEAVLERTPAAPKGRPIVAARASARDVSDLNRPIRKSKAVSPEPEAR
jgi:[protein-PII] uridylyltransferase